MIALDINGKRHNVDVPGDTPLLWVLRDELGLTGTKFGCGMALCGACTVHVDGQPVRSCVTPISARRRTRRSRPSRRSAPTRSARRCRRRGSTMGVPQCGYCQAGQIMSATALLKQHPEADRRRHRRAP